MAVIVAPLVASDDILERLRREDVVTWSWVASLDDSGQWGLVFVRVSNRAASEREWTYSRLALGAESITGGDAATRLQSARWDAGSPLGELGLPPLDAQVTDQRLTTEPGDPPLTGGGWPRSYVTYGNGSPARFAEPLSAADAPYWRDGASAVGEIVFESDGAPLLSAGYSCVHIVMEDRRARFNSVVAHPEHVELGLGGSAGADREGWLIKASFRLTAEDPGWTHVECPADADSVQVPTGGLPPDFSAVLLDATGKVIDRREWRGQPAAAVLAPDSLAAEVSVWLSEGEHTNLEFKQELTNKSTKERFAQTVAAFANTAGGVVLVGVADDGRVVGYDPPKVADHIQRIVTDNVSAPPELTITAVEVSGLPVQVVRVLASSAAPHVIGGRVLVRANATNRDAHPQEIRAMSSDAGVAGLLPFVL